MAKVAILLALYNGASNLRMQIDSYLTQDHSDWVLLVSDDGSSDEGPAIVQDYARRLGTDRVQLLQGPCQGPAANFLNLLRAVPDDCVYAAFSDQDDVWLAHKLQRALSQLQATDQTMQQLAAYCSRTMVCDENLARRRPSVRRTRAPSFRNALVQNIAAGNTLVLNRAAINLLRTALPQPQDVVMHDWWAYQMLTGAGGLLISDEKPGLLYRQHAKNVIGANDSFLALLMRLRMVAGGQYRGWNDRNMIALGAAAHLFTAENRRLLNAFAQARRAPLQERLRGLWRLGLYRQGRIGQAAFWLAALLGRV